ncbi:hypothetical protein GH714_017980 [Hevea brasiliensis]|uniref:Uncharacterized protein n=1 Tax=Hevea brasiliensis TaxID=3981 RepID=A0A6A6NI33_HEVBR|nr:hypothetical protein GH714_017980 [Hevea brasiliensis]
MDSKGKDKRRRIDKESDEARNKKVRQGDPDDATEEEVEEFFAILRSIQRILSLKSCPETHGDNTANEAGPSARVSIMEESWEDSETTL